MRDRASAGVAQGTRAAQTASAAVGDAGAQAREAHLSQQAAEQVVRELLRRRCLVRRLGDPVERRRT